MLKMCDTLREHSKDLDKVLYICELISEHSVFIILLSICSAHKYICLLINMYTL